MQELPTLQPARHRSSRPEEVARAVSEEVRALAAERNAVILAHNYQLPELQDVADLTRRLARALARGGRAPTPT